MFKGTRLIVANQSFFGGDATHQAILDVEAGERGMPEFIPRRAGLRAPPRVARTASLSAAWHGAQRSSISIAR